MEQFLDSFIRMTLGVKLGIAVGLLVLVGVLDYALVFSGQQEERAQLLSRQEELEMQLLDKQQKAKDLSEFQREVERLRQRLSEAEEQLPKKSEIPKLLKDINYEGQQSGLTVLKFELKDEQKKGTFAAVPVSMKVRGNYHEIAVFLDRIAKLSRIVNVTDISLKDRKEINKKIVLTGTYTATTYRFVEPGGKHKKAKKKK